jgi:hypothetical protein
VGRGNSKPETKNGESPSDVIRQKRLERSVMERLERFERLERLELTASVVNEAKRLNVWNDWNGSIQVGSSWRGLNLSHPLNRSGMLDCDSAEKPVWYLVIFKK